MAQTEDRAFRYARRTDWRAILAAGPVVARGVRAPMLRGADPTVHLDRVHVATLDHNVTAQAAGRAGRAIAGQVPVALSLAR